MKFSKTILSLAFAGAIFGATATSANADTYQGNQAPQTEKIYQQAYYGTNQASYSANYGQPQTSNQTTTTTKTTTTKTTTSTTSSTDTNADAIVSLAKQLASKNIPYVWGGESLKGMDCSGLTDYVYQQAAGISLGHNTVTQESHVTKKAVSKAQPGDLLFWGKQGATHHVAIYIGNNQYVAAPQPGQNVEIQTISSAFMPSFAGQVNG